MTKITKRLNVAVLTGLIAATAAFSIPQALAADRGGKGPKGGDRLAKTFARLDVNEDGALSWVEMTDPTVAKAAKILARKDADENGVLSAEEMQRNRHGNAVDLSAIADDIITCVTDLAAEPGNEGLVVPTADSFKSSEARFVEVDTSGDGSVDLTELEVAVINKASNGFNNMDADEDGAVTTQEFGAANKSRRATKKSIRQCVQEIHDAGEV
jgi:Ca2+-binding EF-hand superfamily protein